MRSARGPNKLGLVYRTDARLRWIFPARTPGCDAVGPGGHLGDKGGPSRYGPAAVESTCPYPEVPMVAWSQLLLPALLSCALVFIASSVIHMVLQLHNPGYLKLANEDEVRAAIRKGAPKPGEYILPHCADGKAAGTPEMARKFEEGPNALMYVRPNGAVKIGPFLGKWVLYSLVVSLMAGYLARTALPAGSHYLKVFQIVGASAWLAYAWQGPADSIWKGKPWAATFRSLFDGLVYASLTAGAYGWLWPKAL